MRVLESETIYWHLCFWTGTNILSTTCIFTFLLPGNTNVWVIFIQDIFRLKLMIIVVGVNWNCFLLCYSTTNDYRISKSRGNSGTRKPSWPQKNSTNTTLKKKINNKHKYIYEKWEETKRKTNYLRNH